jgi:hypothetical protein
MVEEVRGTRDVAFADRDLGAQRLRERLQCNPARARNELQRALEGVGGLACIAAQQVRAAEQRE